MAKSRTSTPLVVAVSLVVAGLVIAAVGGLGEGSIIGGVVAALGVVPSAWAAWAGMQQETQTSLAGALAMVMVSLGVGALLIILRVVDWLR